MTSLTMTRNSDQGQLCPPNAPGAQTAEGDIQHLTPKLENKLEDWENECIIVTK